MIEQTFAEAFEEGIGRRSEAVVVVLARDEAGTGQGT